MKYIICPIDDSMTKTILWIQCPCDVYLAWTQITRQPKYTPGKYNTFVILYSV